MNSKKPLLLVLLFLSISSFVLKNSKDQYVFNIKELDKSMKLIPEGELLWSEAYPSTNFTSKTKVNSFFMCDHEVSNAEYAFFLNEICSSDSNLFNQLLPDTTVWEKTHTYSMPYMRYYFAHPAYRNFPVVGVTHYQAQAYCQWLTKFYNQNEKRKFAEVKFRLPKKDEWVFAASEGLSSQIFPWKGIETSNKDGLFLANFLRVRQGDVKREAIEREDTNGQISKQELFIVSNTDGIHLSMDGSFITTEVNSYWPNGYGLYNMGGNVEEYVEEFGITKGGSWNDPGYYMRNLVEQSYDSSTLTSAERGFRVAMEIVVN